MQIVDDALLQQFRESPRCHMCEKPTPEGCQPHHHLRRGMGGGSRLDDPWNLLAVCAACHADIHAGKVTRRQELEAIARRASRTPEQVADWLARVRRADKGKRKPRKR